MACRPLACGGDYIAAHCPASAHRSHRLPRRQDTIRTHVLGGTIWLNSDQELCLISCFAALAANRKNADTLFAVVGDEHDMCMLERFQLLLVASRARAGTPR
eukprot:1247748-Amphidinium_carterae.1